MEVTVHNVEKWQEGGESRISGKDIFRLCDYNTALDQAGRNAGAISSYPGMCSSLPSTEAPLQKPQMTLFLQQKNKTGKSFSMFCSSPTATSYLCPSTPELNQDKRLEPLASIHQNNQTFQKLLLKSLFLKASVLVKRHIK